MLSLAKWKENFLNSLNSYIKYRHFSSKNQQFCKFSVVTSDQYKTSSIQVSGSAGKVLFFSLSYELP